jgi:CRISPR/Cas system-associated endoribonuclease Cas2
MTLLRRPDHYDIDAIINSDLTVREMVFCLIEMKQDSVFDTTMTEAEKAKIQRRCTLIINNYSENYM